MGGLGWVGWQWALGRAVAQPPRMHRAPRAVPCRQAGYSDRSTPQPHSHKARYSQHLTRGGAVVFCEVAPQPLVHVGATQDQQEASASAHPRQQLCGRGGVAGVEEAPAACPSRRHRGMRTHVHVTRTNHNQTRRKHPRTCAMRKASTMRSRACMFCSARFSAALPPCTLRCAHGVVVVGVGVGGHEVARSAFDEPGLPKPRCTAATAQAAQQGAEWARQRGHVAGHMLHQAASKLGALSTPEARHAACDGREQVGHGGHHAVDRHAEMVRPHLAACGWSGVDYWEEKHGSHRAVPRRAAAAWRRPAVVCGHAAVARPSLPTHLLRQLL